MKKYCIINREAIFMDLALKRLSDGINYRHNVNWIPVGSPNVKRDSTKPQVFIAFQLMERQINDELSSEFLLAKKGEDDGQKDS